MVKNPPASAGVMDAISGLGRSPGGGHCQPAPVLLPGESPGQRSLVGSSPWGHRESDVAERLNTHPVVPGPRL